MIAFAGWGVKVVVKAAVDAVKNASAGMLWRICLLLVFAFAFESA